MSVGELEYWTDWQAAEYLRVKRSTLQRWHREGKGPKRHKVGRSWRYLPAEVMAWIASQ